MSVHRKTRVISSLKRLFLKIKAAKRAYVGRLWISTCKYQQYKNNQEWNKKLDGALSNLISWEELLHMAGGLELKPFLWFYENLGQKKQLERVEDATSYLQRRQFT